MYNLYLFYMVESKIVYKQFVEKKLVFKQH